MMSERTVGFSLLISSLVTFTGFGDVSIAGSCCAPKDVAVADTVALPAGVMSVVSNLAYDVHLEPWDLTPILGPYDRILTSTSICDPREYLTDVRQEARTLSELKSNCVFVFSRGKQKKFARQLEKAVVVFREGKPVPISETIPITKHHMNVVGPLPDLYYASVDFQAVDLETFESFHSDTTKFLVLEEGTECREVLDEHSDIERISSKPSKNHPPGCVLM